MRILLIYPEFPDTFWSYKHALRLVRKKALSPPLGLLTVAAMLPQGWEKKLVDLNLVPLTDQDLAWADLIFISGMGVQRDSARAIIARCKAAGKTVVAGGPLFTAEYALFEQVDHFILNEAELTLPPFLADFAKGTAKRVYRTREFADMHQSPVPLWHLADMSQYHSGAIQFSRGCPYDCEFCNVTALFGRRPRTKTGGQITAELTAMRDAGWRGTIFFVDDNLIGHRPSLKNDLLPVLHAWQKTHGPTTFNTQASINLADDEKLTRDMVDAGFDAIFVGIESSDPSSLEECGKSQNRNRDLIADVKRLQKAGLEVQAGFILGFDHDTPATFQQQVDFIQESGIVTAMVGLLHAPPGTQLANRLRSEGRLMGSSSGDNTDGSTNIAPRMGLETLRNGYRWVLDRIYAPGPYYRRCKTFLKNFGTPTCRPPLDWTRIRASLDSVYRLGIVGRERIEYWSLLGWTLLHRPTLLPIAFRLAVCGHHYRKICELHGLCSDTAGSDANSPAFSISLEAAGQPDAQPS
ncbi:MAG: B12-binding domain-containing radical SAM protein [Tepidisphaerales bacterium]